MFNPSRRPDDLPKTSHFRNRLISLILIYALLLQCVSVFSRVTYAVSPPRVMPPPVTAEHISDAVISRHKPTLIRGLVDGSLRVLLGESFTINNATSISSDVYLPGTPAIQLNSGAQHGGVVNDGGPTSPSNYTLTLANNVVLPGRIHSQAEEIELPSMASSVPSAPGNRTVTITSQSQVTSIGDWHTVRDLNVTGSNIVVDMPAGDYGTLTINGNSQVNLSAGTYNFANTFNLDGSATIQATGSVVINVGQNLTINSGALTLGSYTTAANVQLNVLGSSLHIKGSSQVSALISAYNGEAKLSGASQVRGRVIADRVTLNGGKVIGAVWPVLSGAAITLFGPRRFDRTTGLPNQYVEQFSLPPGSTSPYTLHIQNGSLDGANRVSSATITLNGAEVLLAQNDLNQTVPSLDRTVTLNAQNQLNVSLASDPGSYLTIYITGTVPATDTAPPLLEITSPANNYTTTEHQITISGTASDPGSGVAHVYVNGVEASYSTANGTWSLANVALELGANQVVVRAVDQAGNETTATITVTREAPENHSPAVDAGADQSFTLPASALLDGNATDDGFPEGSSLSTTWTKVSGPGTVTFGDASQLSTTASFSTNGTYVLRLTATDGALSNFDEVTITVDPQNQPPTVSAGADQTIALPATATINGTVTDDGLPVGNTVGTTWSKVSGPGTVTFTDPAAIETSATFSEAGTYVLRLTATDGELTSQSEVTITVHPENHAPTVNAGTDQMISLPAQAQLNGTATDDGWPFGSTLTTTWTMVSGPGTVTFGNANATATTATFSAPGTYVLRLTGGDGQLSTTDDVTIVVTPPNQAPLVNAGADQTVSLPQATANLNGVVTDDGLPIGSTLAVMWSVVSGPGDVTFGNANQAVTTAQFTVAGDYVLRLTATDGALATFDDVLVRVTPPNQAPVVNAGADQNVTFPGTVSLSGTVNDDALPIGSVLTTTWSQVSGPGTVTFADAAQVATTASFSAPGNYVLRLSASDSALTGSDDLAVVVIDPRIPPVANFIVPQTTGAVGAFVIASSGSPGSSFAPDLILDNNVNTSWTTNGPSNQFATIQTYDQQSVYIDRVRIQGHQAGTSTSNVKDFEVQVSATTSDAASFVTVLTATYLNNGQLQEFVLPGGPARARFIKYLPKNNYAGGGNILTATFNPVAVGSIESIVSLPGDTDGARSQSPALYGNGGVIHSFSYSGGTNTANGLLGYFSGGWTTTSTTNQFAIVQLGGSAPTMIKGVKLALGQDLGVNAGVKNFEIWISSTTPDAAAFTQVLVGVVPVSAMVQTYLFPGGPVPARYVKYVPLTNQGGTTNAIDTEVFDVVLTSGARVVGVSGEWTGSPNPGEASFDGDLNSTWYSNAATNAWIKTSLTDEQVQKLYGVRISPTGNISFQEGPKDFDIRVSTTTTDDSAFTTVYSGTVAPVTNSAAPTQEFLFPNAVDAKYVQFFWKNGYQSNRIGVRELEPLIYPSRGSAIAAFSSQDELASNCIDLDPQNQVWSTAANQITNQWLKLLMPRGEIANINHIALRPGIAANTFYNGPKDFELQVSTTDANDSSFTTVLSGTFVNNTQVQDYYFPTTQARYVKLLLKNNYGFVRIGVAGFYVFAADEIGTTARFFDQSTDADGPIVSWAWDFGDGTTSTQRNPIHTFPQPGNYTVALTVTDNTGLTHTRQTTYRVTQALQPTFTHSPLTIHEGGEVVKFTDTTRLLVQPGAQRRYIFGDGGTLSQFAFTSIYTYQDSGTFNASMSIGDPQGMNLIASHTVSVLNMLPSVAIDPGKSVFWGEPWTSVPQITDQSPIDRTSLQGKWTFGDGQTFNCVNCTNANATVTHAYANPGTYTATLTITDKDGGAGSDDAIFTVNKRPTSVVFLTQPSLTANGPLTLQARLTDTFGNVVLAGKVIQFSVNGAIFSATTNAQGIAEVSVPLPAGARIDVITGTFAEDDFYQTGSGVTVPVTAGATPTAGTPSNAGTNFWITFPQNFGDGFNNAVQKLFITSTVATSGTVTVPGNNFTQNFTVAANQVTTIQVGGTMSFQSDVIENRGIHVTSLQPITVYGLNQRVFTSDAYLALPVASLGTEYFVLSYGNNTFAAFSEFSMVAQENGTVVTITPSVTSGARVGGVPYNITLNQGQMYQLQNTVPTGAGDLTGTRIVATKPIAVFSGHMAGTVPVDAGCCADHMVEQLPPVTTWGKRFATVPLATRFKGDIFRIIAAEDGTAVYLNGQITATLNKGQWVERTLKVASEIIATKPILVGQYSTSIFFDPPTSGKADPFLMIVPPYSQFLNHYTITTPPTGFEINYINVVAPTAALGNVTLDGTAIPAGSFTPIGVSGFSGAQVAISSGAHTLDGPSGFGLFVYGYNQDEGYGYPGGMNMAPTIAATNVAVIPETQSRSINTQACAVATVTNQDQNPLGGRSVTFTVTGANPTTASGQTDAAGQATFCYTGTNTGTDQISAAVGTSQGTASVVWTPPNQAPVVNAGADQTVTMPFAASLLGSATDDGLPASSLSVTWSKVSGPGTVTFENANAAVTTATFSVAGVYVLRLTASDTALSASDDVQVTVNVPVNQAPVANAGPDATVTINGNLVVNPGNDQQLVNGEIASWTEVQGSSWTRANAIEPQYGSSYFFAGNDAAAELRQDVDVSAFAGSIAAGTQQFEFKAYVRSAVEATPDGARVVLEYRDATNTNVIATLDSGAITSTSAWHLTEDTRVVPAGTGWIRIRLIATRHSGDTNDAFFDSISLRPIGNTAAKLAGTANDDGLPFGSTLSSTWTTISGPGTVAFSNANSPASGAVFTEAGTYVLRLTASDGDLSHTDDVTIVVNPQNLAPAVNAGAAQTITLPATAQLNGTASDDGQPPGSSLTTTWSKVAGPGTVSFANANALTTTATFSVAGVYTLRLTADDSEYASTSDVIVTVNPAPTNQPPTVNAGTDQTISLPTDIANLNGVVTDDGLPAGSSVSISWSRTSGPGTVTFGNANAAVTTAQFSTVGSYVLRLTASDGEFTVFDEVVVTLTTPNQAPTANAGADQTILLSQQAYLEGAVSDDGLPSNTLTTTWSKVSGPGNVSFTDANAVSTTASFSATGVYVLRLTASDSSLSATDDVTVTVNDNVAPPTVEITAPADGTELTEPAPVTGSVSNGAWVLEYSLNSDDGSNNQIWTAVNSGNGPVTNGSLGTLDTTLMLNGIYALRLKSTDEYGQISFTSISVVVDKGFKVGQLQLAFSDMNVPVAGLPIEVIRSYDSRDKRVGDFGVGWQMGLRNARVEKTGVLGLSWLQTVSSGAIPTYCLEPGRPHKVTVTFGDGKVFKFLASTSIHCQQFVPVTSAQMTFTPEPGTHATLQVVGPNDLLVESLGSIPGPVRLLNQNNPDIFNSFTFRLTTAEGVSYVINQQSGVSSINDPYGNTLTINAGGVTHSSGKSITFTRDTLGRITQITDPNGNSQTYGYDNNGDLVTFTDRENHTTTFTYNSDHHLLTIVDARGVNLLTNQYDDAGRLIGQKDAFDKSLIYDHNIAGRVETITDRLGHETRFEYDERGNVLRQVDARGGVKTFTYDDLDNVLTETNQLNKTTTYTYDDAGNQTSITDPLNHVTHFTYNNARQVLTVTDARNEVTTNTYDAAGTNLLTRTDPLNHTTTFTYSIFTGQRTTMKNALNQQTSYDYDAAGRLTTETDPLGNATTYGYDTNSNRTSQTVTRTNAQGQTETITTTFTYDKLNRLTKTTFADGTFTRVEYNVTGQQSATIDQLGHRTEFTYDDMGRLTRTDYADGTHDEATYDAEGRRLTSKDRAGRVTSYEYDELGRLTKTTYADNTFTTTEYDAAGQVLTTTDARGNVTHYEYDAAGRRTKIRNALNQETTFTYDANGNQLTLTDALQHTTTYEYDDNNRRTKTTYHDNSFDTVAYDELGRSVSKTDQAGKTTHFFYDELSRLTKVKDALNQETTYSYNELGQQLTQTDANNHTTRFEYDQLGRRVKRVLPAGQFETYSYDTGGNLQSRTDFNGKTTTFTYDVMRRLSTKVPDASLNQPTVSFTYNANGQRATMNDAAGATVYTYDVRNRLASRQTPFGTLSYTYDEGGNLLTTRSSNANGVSVDYTYDVLNRLSTVKDNRLPALNGGVTSYNYDDVGNLESYLYPNGVTTSYHYNALNRLTSMGTAAGATTQSSYAYTLGPAGNRTAVSELGGRTVNYTYDDLYRLTNETIANDPHSVNGTVGYDYDAVGNRLSRTSTVTGVPAQTSTFDANDRLNSDTYDANGSTTASNSNTYAYDFENHLTSLNNGAVTFGYDGDGNRVSKTVGSVTTNYLVDTNNHTGYAQVVEELQNSAVTKQFTYGHDLISQTVIGGSTSFYSYDGHGSVRQLTDASASITDTYDYDAFGLLIDRTGTTANDYLYSGEQFDPNLGFYYQRSRYLNPHTGRFHSFDTYEGISADPLSLHKYLFGQANPVNRVDPSGRASLVETIEVSAIVGALAGGINGLIRTGTLRGAAKGAVFGALTGAAVTLGVSGIGVGVAFLSAGAISASTASIAVGGTLAGYSLGRDTLEILSAESRRDRIAAGVSMLFTVAGVSYGAYKFENLPNNAAESFGPPASRAQLGEYFSETLALLRGETVVARQVTIETATTRVRVDLVTRTLFGRLRLIESKFGPNAKFTDNQEVGYPELLQSGGTVRGANGVGAGLPAGTRIQPQEVLTDWWE